MALMKFKRILPALPTQEVYDAILAEALRVVREGTEAEWNDSFELNDFKLLEPTAPDSEFTNNTCVFCGGHRVFNEAQYKMFLQNGVSEYRLGHRSFCNRWLKSWKYVDYLDRHLVERRDY
jgi:hypothetical protein